MKHIPNLRTLILTNLIGLALMSSSLHAHRAWILPSSSTLSGTGQWISVDAVVSNDLFYANYRPMNPDSIVVTSPQGEKVEIDNVQRGQVRTVFDVPLNTEGTYRIAAPRTGYFAQWTENGERMRRRGDLETFRADGLFEHEDLELRKTASQLETYVTCGAPSEAIFTPNNEGIEFVPITHPNDLYTNEAVTFKFLVDGKPQADVEITIIRGDDRYRDDPGVIELKTDSEGQISLIFEEPGYYWLNTSTRADTGSLDGKPLAISYSYTSTFEVLPQ